MVPASQLPRVSPAAEQVGRNPLFLFLACRGRTEAVPPGEPLAAQLQTQALGGSCQGPDRFPRREPAIHALLLPSRAFALTGVKSPARLSLPCHLPARHPA